jgi:hypothetical protein
MNITPVIKGQLTKAINANKDKSDGAVIRGMTVVLQRYSTMPKQQAKHQARKLFAAA